MHLAWTQIEIDAVERDNAREMLRYLLESEQGRSSRRRGNPGLARYNVNHGRCFVAGYSTLNVGLKSSGASDEPLSKLLTFLLSIT